MIRKSWLMFGNTSPNVNIINGNIGVKIVTPIANKKKAGDKNADLK